MISFILILLCSFFICIASIVLANKNHFGIDSIKKDKPQKMHQKNTARIGGIGIFVAFLCSFFFHFETRYYLIIIGLGLVFLSGILEDLFDFIKPKVRLCIQALGITIMLFSGYNGLISDLSPIIILHLYPSILFSIFGICGVCNALNIIDGLNGLASGIALLVLITISYISMNPTQTLALIAIASTLGFFILNFPFGKIFLGDGGSYFLGALIGLLLGNLSNNGISAWFGLSTMIYPVWEVIFSIIRRKIHNKPAMQPDSLHLHSLLYQLVKHNALTSLIILFIYALYLFIILNLKNSAMAYIIASLFFICFYTLIYFSLCFLISKSKK